MRIAVTGNIGSGKSTVMRLLAAGLPGYREASVDRLVRELYEAADFQAALTQQFGTCNRSELSNLAFATPTIREELQQLAMRWLVPQLENLLTEERLLVEFPLLHEMPGWSVRFDHVVAIACDEETRRRRTLERDGISAEKFARISNAQWTDALKQAFADSVIDNSGGLPELERSVEENLSDLRVAALRLRCERFFRSNRIAQAVMDAYNEVHRGYHTPFHLLELFDVLNPVLKESPHAMAIEMAVWFHDFVYSTDRVRYADNEKLSAQALMSLVRQEASWLLEEHSLEVALAGEMILCTKGHQLPSTGLGMTADRLDAIGQFLDADLSILVSSEVRLLAYDEQIAFEWLGVNGLSRRAFAEGRVAALQSFESREVLYFSPPFKALEARARENLQRLINRWSAELA